MTDQQPNQPGGVADDSWGPHRETIEGLLGHCADYLSRLQRSLAGEIAPDRHYFNDKARQLHDVARALVRRGQEVKHWLAECGEPVTVDPRSSTAYEDYCSLPTGHVGDHWVRPYPSPAENSCKRARDLADRTDEVSQELGWLETDIDLRDPNHHLLIPEQIEEVKRLKATVEGIAHDAMLLATSLQATVHSLEASQRFAERTQGPEAAIDGGGLGV